MTEKNNIELKEKIKFLEIIIKQHEEIIERCNIAEKYSELMNLKVKIGKLESLFLLYFDGMQSLEKTKKEFTEITGRYKK